MALNWFRFCQKIGWNRTMNLPDFCARVLIEISLHCETIFCQFHLDTAATFKDKSCSRFFGDLMAAERQYVEMLQKYLAALAAS